MPHQDVHFLNPGRLITGHDDKGTGETAQSSAILAGECSSSETSTARDFESGYHVWAITGSRKTQCDITGLAESFELPGEDVLKAEIISASGERRRVGCESQTCESAAIIDKAYGKFGCQMLCICGATAVAEKKRYACYPARLGRQVLPEREERIYKPPQFLPRLERAGR